MYQCMVNCSMELWSLLSFSIIKTKNQGYLSVVCSNCSLINALFGDSKIFFDRYYPLDGKLPKPKVAQFSLGQVITLAATVAGEFIKSWTRQSRKKDGIGTMTHNDKCPRSIAPPFSILIDNKISLTDDV